MKKVLLICFVVLLVCCKKKDNAVEPDPTPPIKIDTVVIKYDTVPIGSYFPVYPKSIWYYKDLNGNEVIHQTDSIYTLSSEPRLKAIYLKPVFVPKYDHMIVNVYEWLDTPWPPFQDPWLQLLPPDIKKGFYVAKDGPNEFNRMAVVNAVDTSLVVNSVQYDSVIIVTYSSLSSPTPPTYAPYQRLYFAKNIGIIKRTFLSSGSVSGEEVLVNYKLGKK